MGSDLVGCGHMYCKHVGSGCGHLLWRLTSGKIAPCRSWTRSQKKLMFLTRYIARSTIPDTSSCEHPRIHHWISSRETRMRERQALWRPHRRCSKVEHKEGKNTWALGFELRLFKTVRRILFKYVFTGRILVPHGGTRLKNQLRVNLLT